METLRAIGIGSPVADILINTDRLPGPDQAVRLLEMSYQFGGKVPTAMAALGRLGVRCGMVGVVGDDHEGRACIADFRRNNVDASKMVVDPAVPTRLSVVLSNREAGGRNFLRREERVRGVFPDELDKEYIKQAQVLHISAAGETERIAATWVREAGGKVSLDADGYKPAFEEMAPLIDAFITSEQYYRDRYQNRSMSVEQCCRDIASRGPSMVAVTLGARGSACLYNGEFRTVEAYTVPVVDATGAGDTYHGAFIYGILQGWDTMRCAKFASAVAAIKCMAIGGRAGLPTLETTERFMEEKTLSAADWAEINARKQIYKKPHGLQDG